ncbi:MAG: FKBP-type peptidyl-prolyl cis-trans isomerase [Chitinophagaceae bacterium]
MKYILVITIMLLFNAAIAQNKATIAKQTAATANPLKNLTDSASYAIGLSVANFYMQQGIKKLNPAIVAKAINDVMSGKKSIISHDAANNVVLKLMNQAQDTKSKPNIAEGEKFLAANKAKPGVKTTATGLQYEILTEGTGAKPTLNDTVVCHYKGMLLNGTEFDNSYTRGQPATFPVRGVIKGWTEALQLMSVGSKYRLYIPHQLAYGGSGTGPIPGGALLIFEVELLDVKKKQ